LTKFENYQILLNKISHRFLLQQSYLVGVKEQKVNAEFLMEQQIFKIVINYRGRHRKGIIIYNSTELSSQQKTLVSLNKYVFMNTTERLK
jgi:hypothetical protein